MTERALASAGHRLAPAVALVILYAGSAAGADLLSGNAPAAAYAERAPYEWTGFYLGGHLGYAWGNSNWTASTISGLPLASSSLDFSQGVDTFDEAGSWFAGVQAGYNTTLPNRVVIGAEIDVSFPAYPNPISGLSVGGTSTLANGDSYSENVFASGTVRARVGYAPGNWLYYATAGLAWTDDKFTLAQASGATDSSFLFRLGWAAGAGVEGPILPHWTARLEYLFKDYDSANVTFPAAAQRFNSDLNAARSARRFELPFRRRCGLGEGRAEGGGVQQRRYQLPRPGDLDLAGLSRNPIAF